MASSAVLAEFMNIPLAPRPLAPPENGIICLLKEEEEVLLVITSITFGRTAIAVRVYTSLGELEHCAMVSG